MLDIIMLAEIEILDQNEQKVRVGDFWRDRTVVLAFIRHFG